MENYLQPKKSYLVFFSLSFGVLLVLILLFHQAVVSYTGHVHS